MAQQTVSDPTRTDDPATPKTDEQTPYRLPLLDVYDLAAEMRDLQGVINKIQRGEVARADFAEYLHKTWQDIRQIITRLNEPSELHRPFKQPRANGAWRRRWRRQQPADGSQKDQDAQRERYIQQVEEDEQADTIRHLHNLWEQMGINPLLVNPQENQDLQVQSHLLTMLDEQISNSLYLLTRLTIWDRIAKLIPLMKPGNYLPFHLAFAEEVRSQEQRVRLLNYISLSPKRIAEGGLVDAANGLIYRYEDVPWKRRGMYGVVIFVLLILSLGAAVLSWRPLLPWEQIPENILTTLLAAWGSTLAGLATHAAIGSIKRAQSRAGLPPVIAVDDIPLLFNALSGQIMVKLVMAFLGFCGLVFTSQSLDQVTITTGFLLGYSLDSFIEIFGANIAQRANAQAAALKQQLGMGGAA